MTLKEKQLWKPGQRVQAALPRLDEFERGFVAREPEGLWVWVLWSGETKPCLEHLEELEAVQ